MIAAKLAITGRPGARLRLRWADLGAGRVAGWRRRRIRLRHRLVSAASLHLVGPDLARFALLLTALTC